MLHTVGQTISKNGDSIPLFKRKGKFVPVSIRYFCLQRNGLSDLRLTLSVVEEKIDYGSKP